MCAIHPFVGEPSVPPLILPGLVVNIKSFGSPLTHMSRVQLKPKSSWIYSRCDAVPNDIVIIQGRCSLIATSTTGCSRFCTLATIDLQLPDWLRGIPLTYGVWHSYKHVCHVMWRKFFALFAYITAPFEACPQIYDHRKLIDVVTTLAMVLLVAPDLQPQLRRKIALLQARGDQAALHTQDRLRMLWRLDGLLNYYPPTMFVVGRLMRSLIWAGRAAASGTVATCALQRCVGLFLNLAGPAEAKMYDVGTICYILVHNAEWHDHTPGAVHVECCEALLAKLWAGCKQQPDKHTADEAGDLFHTMPLANTRNVVLLRKCVC